MTRTPPFEIHVLVEEPSAKAALSVLLPKIAGPEIAFRIISFDGKPQLLRRLPERLRAYQRRLEREALGIVVLVDRDREDCTALKDRLETMARDAGLTTKSAATETRFTVVNRIAVEELEAWFFGDFPALHAAYGHLPGTLDRKKAFRHPDRIQGGTAEALHRQLSRAGYDFPVLPKIQVARAVAAHMDPGRNISPSFQAFRNGLRALVAAVGGVPDAGTNPRGLP